MSISPTLKSAAERTRVEISTTVRSENQNNLTGESTQTSTEALSSSATTAESILRQPSTTQRLTGAMELPDAPILEKPSPWDLSPVSSRVTELMRTENLSQDAAIVVAMTERTTVPGNQDSVPTLDEGWRTEFAQIVSRSGNELAAWAESQDTGTVTFVEGDNDIQISQRADGMLVIESSLNGVIQNTQIVDPSTSDRIVINAGAGDDQITVDDSVTANLLLAGGAGDDFIYGGGGNEIILGGSGNDLIRAGAGTDIVLGGTGNDNLEGQDGGDILLGQEGDDYLSGDKGNDILFGGNGQDTIYGGDNQDILLGQGGNDYIDAGSGNDLAIGGTGDDVISGGKGNDELHGNTGADTLIGASGSDRYHSMDSSDTLIVDSELAANSLAANVPGADVRLVEIDQNAGNEAIYFAPNQREEFVTRVEDDLETLRSLESGKSMLNALDKATSDSTRPDNYFFGINLGGSYNGHRIQMQELDGAGHINFLRNSGSASSTENGFASPNSSDWKTSDPVNNPAGGTGATILYNPSVNLQLNTGVATPPVIVLFHELAHSYNMATGTGLSGIYNGVDDNNNGGTVNNTERQAVGLAVDHDNDPSTPEKIISDAAHPFAMTENGLRTELNIPLRPFY